MHVTTSVWIGCGAATVWALAAMSTARGLLKTATLLLAAVLDLALIICANAHPALRIRMMQPFRQTLYTGAVVAEAIGILIAVVLLRRVGRKQAIAPVVSIIVGLHFIGLWEASGLQLFLWLAMLLAVAGCAGLAWGRAATQKFKVADGALFLTGLWSAAAFWIVAAATILESSH